MLWCTITAEQGLQGEGKHICLSGCEFSLKFRVHTDLDEAVSPSVVAGGG
jgi:hypothetical protein